MKPNLALVIRAPGEVALEERPIPTPGPGEVLVRVQYTAVLIASWPRGTTPPRTATRW